MKKIGLLGGLGYESTLDYYKSVLVQVHEAAGSYPNLLINSVDIKTMLGFLERGDTEGLADFLAGGINALEQAGCSCAVIASNTPHVAIEAVRRRVEIPLLSIVDCVLEEVRQRGCLRVGVLGTAFTIKSALYSGPLEAAGIAAPSPGEADAAYLNDKIFNELEYGVVKPETRRRFLQIVSSMRERHQLDGLILGCTELPLILSSKDFAGLEVFNTTDIHIRSIVREILQA